MTKGSAYASLALVLALSAVLTNMPFASAAGEAFTTVANKVMAPDNVIHVTDLQVTGTGNDTISVMLEVDSGELWFDGYSNVDILGQQASTKVGLYGPREDVNNALAELYYWNDIEGTYSIEATISHGHHNPANGHVYRVVEASGISWYDAKTAAEAMTYGGATGYLATITSQEEQDFIIERIDQPGWIGGSDEAVEGEWRWATGPEANTQFWQGGTPANGGEEVGSQYVNWSEDEPNNANDDENCTQIWFAGDNPGGWNDLDCLGDANEYYVVEFGAPGALPAVPTTSFDIFVGFDRQNVSVSNCDQLFALRNDPSRADDNISLTADIDCGGRTEAPLFDDFYGKFEGNGFTIKNLVIENEEGEHVGLTGFSEGAVYRNIFMDNIRLKGGYHNGLLAGHVKDSIVAENIHATNVTMTYGEHEDNGMDTMGVLFGVVEIGYDAEASSIEHVSVQGEFLLENVDYVECVGGLVGTIEAEGSLTIKQAYADVNMTIRNMNDDASSVGGLVGCWEIEVDDQDMVQQITDSYTWGSIAAPEGEYVGGLIGYVENDAYDDGDLTVAINNSYSWMDIDAYDYAGGLIGYVDEIYDEGGTYTYEINNSFYAGTLHAEEDGGIIVGYYDDSGEELSTLTFDNVWYDAAKVEGYDCVGNMMMSQCSAANEEGDNPNYFIDNKANAPMNQWDFATIWRTQAGTPPVFKPFIGNDADQDGVNNYIESRAPGSGDGNADGTQDSQQSNVASLVSPVSGKYVTLAVGAACELSDVSISRESNHAAQDAAYAYDAGFVNFTATGCDDGETSVKLYFHGAATGAFTARKYNSNTNAYFTVPGAMVTTAPLPLSAVLVTYTVSDGGILDIDGEDNGVIVDPVGLGFLGVDSPNTGIKRVR